MFWVSPQIVRPAARVNRTADQHVFRPAWALRRVWKTLQLMDVGGKPHHEIVCWDDKPELNVVRDGNPHREMHDHKSIALEYSRVSNLWWKHPCEEHFMASLDHTHTQKQKKAKKTSILVIKPKGNTLKLVYLWSYYPGFSYILASYAHLNAGRIYLIAPRKRE